MRLGMPDSACKSIDVAGRRYQPDSSGTVEVSDPRHARLLIREGQAFVASGQTAARPGGHPCRCCGFASFFRRCSRCGSDNPRETP